MSLSPHPERESVPLLNDETINSKAIRKEIRPEVLKLLRAYHETVIANGPTPSEASQTTAPAYSIASTGTSMTGMTSTFSIDDEVVQSERSVVPLGPVARARKGLMRKLGACKEECRARRVKCKLWHHKLDDLLIDSDTSADRSLVEWALQFDADPSHHPVRSIRVANFVAGESSGVRHEAIDQATNAFGVPPAPPLPYGSVIQETTASLLDPYPASSPRPRLRPDPIDENLVLPTRFSTEMSDGMFPIGTRDDTAGPFQFLCKFHSCTYTSDSESLLVHFEYAHLNFERLRDPFRIECHTCGKFYAFASAECCPRVGPMVVEKLYGKFINTAILTPPRFGLRLSNSHPMGYRPSSGSSLLGPVSHTYDHGHSHGQDPYNSFRSGIHMGSRSMKAVLFQILSPFVPFMTFLFRKIRQLARGRRYTVTFTAAVLISILFGRDWILSKLAQCLGAASNLNLPLVGMVFMSIPFALHRFVVHAHRYTGARPESWLSRCAMKLLNVACRQPTEPGQLAYELGHSMS